MASTSSLDGKSVKFHLEWNDKNLIDIYANIALNSITICNLLADNKEEFTIQCWSKNINGSVVKLYFQHYNSFRSNQTLPIEIDATKLMDFLLVANYFDDPAMILTITRRIISLIHNILPKVKKGTEATDKLKSLRKKFSLLPFELQDVILNDLEEYAAIKGSYHLVRHVSFPVDKDYRMKDVLITDQGKVIAALTFSKSAPDNTFYGPLFLKFPLDMRIECVELYDFPVLLKLPHEIGVEYVEYVELYDELNSKQAAALNKLNLGFSAFDDRVYIPWRYDGMGGLVVDGVVWALRRSQPLEDSVGPYTYKMDYYFYLPDGSRIKAKDQVMTLVKHRRIAIIHSVLEDLFESTHRFRYINEIVDIPTGGIIHSFVDYIGCNHIYCDHTGRYVVILICSRMLLKVELYEIGKSQPIFQSVIDYITSLLCAMDQLVAKIDPYRRLIYIFACSMFKTNDKTDDRIVLNTLIILNFKGQMVARYHIPRPFSLYFSPDILVTIEYCQPTPLLASLPKLTDYPTRTTRVPSSIATTALKSMPQIASTNSEYIIVERDINNGWRPLAILSKIPASINPVIPQVIFSPNGHYLLVAPLSRRKLRYFGPSTVVSTRLHPADEIAMIREALIGPADSKVDISPCKASTSSAPCQPIT